MAEFTVTGNMTKYLDVKALTAVANPLTQYISITQGDSSYTVTGNYKDFTILCTCTRSRPIYFPLVNADFPLQLTTQYNADYPRYGEANLPVTPTASGVMRVTATADSYTCSTALESEEYYVE